jgi:hypothetical protein
MKVMRPETVLPPSPLAAVSWMSSGRIDSVAWLATAGCGMGATLRILAPKRTVSWSSTSTGSRLDSPMKLATNLLDGAR